MTTPQRVLMLMRKTPTRGSLTRETLDVALVLGAFEQVVSVLLREDAVWHLLGSAAGADDDVSLKTLLEFDIDEIYVCAESLRARGLPETDFSIPAKVVDRAAQAELLAGQTVVLND